MADSHPAILCPVAKVVALPEHLFVLAKEGSQPEDSLLSRSQCLYRRGLHCLAIDYLQQLWKVLPEVLHLELVHELFAYLCTVDLVHLADADVKDFIYLQKGVLERLFLGLFVFDLSPHILLEQSFNADDILMVVVKLPPSVAGLAHKLKLFFSLNNPCPLAVEAQVKVLGHRVTAGEGLCEGFHYFCDRLVIELFLQGFYLELRLLYLGRGTSLEFKGGLALGLNCNEELRKVIYDDVLKVIVDGRQLKPIFLLHLLGDLFEGGDSRCKSIDLLLKQYLDGQAHLQYLFHSWTAFKQQNDHFRPRSNHQPPHVECAYNY